MFILKKKLKVFLYSTKEIERLIPYFLIEKFPSNYYENWDSNLFTISKLYFKNKKNIEILKLGNIEEQILDLFLSKLKVLTRILKLI